MTNPEETLINLVRNGSAEELVCFVKQQDTKTKQRIVAAADIEFRLANHLHQNAKHDVPHADEQCKNSPELRCSLIRITILGCCSLSVYKTDCNCSARYFRD